MRDELSEAKRNRAAQVGLVVFTPATRPPASPRSTCGSGMSTASSTRTRPTRPCWMPPSGWPDCTASPRSAEREVEVDTAAIGAALIVVRGQLDAIRALKTQLTSIGTMSREVNGGLDRLREGVLAARGGRGARPEACRHPAGRTSGGRLSILPAASGMDDAHHAVVQADAPEHQDQGRPDAVSRAVTSTSATTAA